MCNPKALIAIEHLAADGRMVLRIVYDFQDGQCPTTHTGCSFFVQPMISLLNASGSNIMNLGCEGGTLLSLQDIRAGQAGAHVTPCVTFVHDVTTPAKHGDLFGENRTPPQRLKS